MKREGYGPARADVLPAYHTFAPEELPDPRLLANAFGQALRRAGGRSGEGWLYGAIHGEHAIETGLIDLHWHMLAAGSWLMAIENLAQAAQLRAPTSGTDHPPAARRPAPTFDLHSAELVPRPRSAAG